MYLKVPMINGIADIDYSHIKFMCVPEPPNFCYVITNNIPENAEIISEEEFLIACKIGNVSVDKQEIKADGVDKATITAIFQKKINKCIFRFQDCNVEVLAQLREDGCYEATLDIMATTPGVINCYVGDILLPDKRNEVTIHAVEAS